MTQNPLYSGLRNQDSYVESFRESGFHGSYSTNSSEEYSGMTPGSRGSYCSKC